MKETKKDAPTQAQRDHAVDNLPGAAVDHDNDSKVTQKSVDERTSAMNNNPRNHH